MLKRDLTDDDRRLLDPATVLLHASSSFLPLQLKLENRGAMGIVLGGAEYKPRRFKDWRLASRQWSALPWL